MNRSILFNCVKFSNEIQCFTNILFSAPVSLAFLNPIGFIIIEIGKSRNENNKSGWKIFKKVGTKKSIYYYLEIALEFDLVLIGS